MSAVEMPKRDGELPAETLLKELREWFRGEVEAGDTSLQSWVDRIVEVIGK